MAFDFNGTTQYFWRSGAPLSAVPISMAAWFNADTKKNSAIGIGSSTTNDRFSLTPWSSGTLFFTTNAAGVAGEAAATGIYPVTTWFHGCGTSSATNQRTCYRDGANSGTDATNLTPANLDNVAVGAINQNGVSAFFDGKIAEFGIWNVALDAQEVAALAKGFSPRLIRPSALKFYWPGIKDGTIELKGAPLTGVASPVAANHPRILYPYGQQIVSLYFTVQIIRPDSDVSEGTWTTETGGTTLYASIDETVIDDADYIQSALNPVSDICKVTLSNPTGGLGMPTNVRYRYKRQGDRAIDLTVNLTQGTTIIATWTHTNISSSFTTVTQTLSTAEVASITDANDLQLWFTANAT